MIRLNGFQPPYHYRQVLAWIVLVCVPLYAVLVVVPVAIGDDGKGYDSSDVIYYACITFICGITFVELILMVMVTVKDPAVTNVRSIVMSTQYRATADCYTRCCSSPMEIASVDETHRCKICNVSVYVMMVMLMTLQSW